MKRSQHSPKKSTKVVTKVHDGLEPVRWILETSLSLSNHPFLFILWWKTSVPEATSRSEGCSDLSPSAVGTPRFASQAFFLGDMHWNRETSQNTLKGRIRLKPIASGVDFLSDLHPVRTPDMWEKRNETRSVHLRSCAFARAPCHRTTLVSSFSLHTSDDRCTSDSHQIPRHRESASATA